MGEDAARPLHGTRRPLQAAIAGECLMRSAMTYRGARGRCGTFIAALAALWCLTGVSAQAQTPVRFTLDWRFEGPAAPFTVALDKGYFKAEGLDVTIDPAAGSREPISRVASGA
jgi:ABC-type nitrate/sulfonate/bicarbonate transport system substrate-binding protein